MLDRRTNVDQSQMLEADYSANRIGFSTYVSGLEKRYTQYLPFRHFVSRHLGFHKHFRLLYTHLNEISRSHLIYNNTNGLPTEYKASTLLNVLPSRSYFQYRFARRVCFTDVQIPSSQFMTQIELREWISYLSDIYGLKKTGYHPSPWALNRICNLKRKVKKLSTS